MTTRSGDAGPTRPTTGTPDPLRPDTLLEVRGLTKTFPVRQGLISRWRGEPGRAVQALTDVNLSVKRGETLGIVGESGCGKSTLARTLVRLYTADSGAVRYGGQDVLALKGAELRHRVVAVGTSQEEIGVFGAHVSGHRLDPVAGVAVDVTHETKQPGVSEKKYGVVPFGSGANLAVGPMTSPAILRQMQDAAGREGIPYTLSASGRYTGTDADALTLVRSGVPTAVVSIPNRYMHSPSEMVDARDVRACIDIIAAWIRELDVEADFTR